MTTTDMHSVVRDPATPPPTGRPDTPPVLVAGRELTRDWGTGANAHRAVDAANFDVHRGELLAVVGPSGSGKSTLGAMIAGIDQPTSGSLVVDGVRLDQLRADALATWRASHVGIVFQNFHLIPTLTALENVRLGLRYGRSRRERRAGISAAHAALDAVGLADRQRRLPSQMSGGEQQRVAIARAIVDRPPLIVADEPTGSLDSASGAIVFELIRSLSSNGTTVVFITHDNALAAAADRTITLVDGRITGSAS